MRQEKFAEKFSIGRKIINQIFSFNLSQLFASMSPIHANKANPILVRKCCEKLRISREFTISNVYRELFPLWRKFHCCFTAQRFITCRVSNIVGEFNLRICRVSRRRGAVQFQDRACRFRSIMPSNETDSLSPVLARNSSWRKPVVLNHWSIGRSVTRLALSHDAIFSRRQ